ncbi:hypothetical protein BDP55DRAFT_645649 [Colletotrichum godetiae]|uniref:Uncharacterized protein n=1 Tax=Colletotrichum godetiae TaxID=1209918 RepID=A0AAJ0B066_9PEZI|nr:uncharacterized protein BDP55DRAFT_645649 [Colletotrichum godetiae]KAK1700013.1 hypothetical protein BDP55DRAFT_645649 [Colletotrichum godetiae]
MVSRVCIPRSPPMNRHAGHCPQVPPPHVLPRRTSTVRKHPWLRRHPRKSGTEKTTIASHGRAALRRNPTRAEGCICTPYIGYH